MGNLLYLMPLDAHTLYSVLPFYCYTCVNHLFSVRKETLTTTHDLAKQGHGETQSHHRQSIVLPKHNLLLMATMVTTVR